MRAQRAFNTALSICNPLLDIASSVVRSVARAAGDRVTTIGPWVLEVSRQLARVRAGRHDIASRRPVPAQSRKYRLIKL